MESKLVYLNNKNEFEKILNSVLDRMSTKEIESCEIENIPSSVFCEMTGCEADDFNGWQCDWWGTFTRNNTKFSVSGCAWYGTVTIGLS